MSAVTRLSIEDSAGDVLHIIHDGDDEVFRVKVNDGRFVVVAGTDCSELVEFLDNYTVHVDE